MPCGQTELQEFTRYFLKVDVQFVTKIKMEVTGENGVPFYQFLFLPYLDQTKLNSSKKLSDSTFQTDYHLWRYSLWQNKPVWLHGRSVLCTGRNRSENVKTVRKVWMYRPGVNKNNITKANYYYRLKRVRQMCLDQLPEVEKPAFVELPCLKAERTATVP